MWTSRNRGQCALVIAKVVPITRGTKSHTLRTILRRSGTRPRQAKTACKACGVAYVLEKLAGPKGMSPHSGIRWEYTYWLVSISGAEGMMEGIIDSSGHKDRGN